MEIPDSYREALNCLKKVHVKTEACIHFSDLKNPVEAVERYLTTQVLRWFSHAEGILICFSDLEIPKPQGKLVDESPYVFFPISFKALVFQPKEGSYLVGKVNEVSMGFAHFLVLGIFQGVILLDDLNKAGYEFKNKSFINKSNGITIHVGTIIKFKALKIRQLGVDKRLEIQGSIRGVKNVVVLQPDKGADPKEGAYIARLQTFVSMDSAIKPEFRLTSKVKQINHRTKKLKPNPKEETANQVGENPENIDLDESAEEAAEANQVTENPESIELEL